MRRGRSRRGKSEGAELEGETQRGLPFWKERLVSQRLKEKIIDDFQGQYRMLLYRYTQV
jgi:hypothetical protein